jgi:hypothetical protein
MKPCLLRNTKNHTKKTMNIKISMILMLGILAAWNAKAQTVLLNQPFNTSLSSWNDSGSYWDCFDDFTLSGGGVVNQVGWSGLGGSGITLNDFSVIFYSDDNGLPGTLLASNNIPDYANQTPSGSDYEGHILYNYSGTLAAPFSAAPGTEYFLSVHAYTGFTWQASSVGNNGGMQEADGTPDSSGNFAFTLEGSAVPEPGTITLGLIGASAFLFRRRR